MVPVIFYLFFSRKLTILLTCPHLTNFLTSPKTRRMLPTKSKMIELNSPYIIICLLLIGSNITNVCNHSTFPLPTHATIVHSPAKKILLYYFVLYCILYIILVETTICIKCQRRDKDFLLAKLVFFFLSVLFIMEIIFNLLLSDTCYFCWNIWMDTSNESNL